MRRRKHSHPSSLAARSSGRRRRSNGSGFVVLGHRVVKYVEAAEGEINPWIPGKLCASAADRRGEQQGEDSRAHRVSACVKISVAVTSASSVVSEKGPKVPKKKRLKSVTETFILPKQKLWSHGTSHGTRKLPPPPPSMYTYFIYVYIYTYIYTHIKINVYVYTEISFLRIQISFLSVYIYVSQYVRIPEINIHGQL